MIFVQINDLCKEQGLHCHIDSVMTSIELPFHEYCARLARAASSSSSSFVFILADTAPAAQIRL